jgi:hypothetical protein
VHRRPASSQLRSGPGRAHHLGKDQADLQLAAHRGLDELHGRRFAVNSRANRSAQADSAGARPTAADRRRRAPTRGVRSSPRGRPHRARRHNRGARRSLLGAEIGGPLAGQESLCGEPDLIRAAFELRIHGFPQAYTQKGERDAGGSVAGLGRMAGATWKTYHPHCANLPNHIAACAKSTRAAGDGWVTRPPARRGALGGDSAPDVTCDSGSRSVVQPRH